ncbi:MAG: hypothetical protein V4482_06110 [Pseudomonadota bacterium]
MKHNFYAKFIICALALAVQGFAAEKQRIEQTVGIIKTEHDLRCGEFNRNIKVLQRTEKINDLLKNEGIVSRTQAETDQKKTILQAVMAGQLIHFPELREQKFAASIYDKRATLGATDYRYKHFEILRLTEELSFKIAGLTRGTGHYDGLTILGELNDAYKDISTYSGVAIRDLAGWFAQAYKDHEQGFQLSKDHSAKAALPLKQGYGAAILQAQPDPFGAAGSSSGGSMFPRKEVHEEMGGDPMEHRALAISLSKKPGDYISDEDDTDLAAAIAASLESAAAAGGKASGKMQRGYRAPGDEAPSHNNEDCAYFPLGAAVDYEYQQDHIFENVEYNPEDEDDMVRHAIQLSLGITPKPFSQEKILRQRQKEAKNLKAALVFQAEEDRIERERLAQLEAERAELAERELRIKNEKEQRATYEAKVRAAERRRQDELAAQNRKIKVIMTIIERQTAGRSIEEILYQNPGITEQDIIDYTKENGDEVKHKFTIEPVYPKENNAEIFRIKIKDLITPAFEEESIIINGITWTINNSGEFGAAYRGEADKEAFITPDQTSSGKEVTLTYTFKTKDGEAKLKLTRTIP